MYVLLSGLGTTLRDLLPLRRHVPLSVFYRLVKALYIYIYIEYCSQGLQMPLFNNNANHHHHHHHHHHYYHFVVISLGT